MLSGRLKLSPGLSAQWCVVPGDGVVATLEHHLSLLEKKFSTCQFHKAVWNPRLEIESLRCSSPSAIALDVPDATLEHVAGTRLWSWSIKDVKYDQTWCARLITTPLVYPKPLKPQSGRLNEVQGFTVGASLCFHDVPQRKNTVLERVQDELSATGHVHYACCWFALSLLSIGWNVDLYLFQEWHSVWKRVTKDTNFAHSDKATLLHTVEKMTSALERACFRFSLSHVCWTV